MFKPLVRAALTVSVLAFVAGCGDKPADSAATPAAVAPASSAAPDAALRRSVELLKAGDFPALMQNSMPPDAYAKLKADWAKEKNEKPATDEERQKFAEMMTKLTAPNADQTLYTEIEPQLKAFDAQYQQQIPMYVTMGSSWLQGMVQQNKDLSDADKQQAVAAINSLATWVQSTRFTDPAAIKKVLAIATKTARDVNLKTLDEARALDFDQTMGKAKVVYGGVKEALGVYGFSIDGTLDSIKPEVVSNDGKTAKVKVSYTLLNSPLVAETEMVNVDGRWYGKHALDKVNEKNAQAPTTAPAAPATAAAPDAEKKG